jgi:nucleotide-binding universal stress UspA family protein
MTQRRQRIVVGLDDSAGGRAALTFALHDAARRDAEVEAVVAVELPDYWGAVYSAVPLASTEEVREAVRVDSARIVEEVSAAAAPAFLELPPVTLTVAAGKPSDVLVRAAREADLLVVGSRGRGGIASAVLGSVSLQCALHGPCPVTVVHPAPASIQSASAATETASAMS